mmetsp:Transcript_679/g.2289  ORF Transcript_679/g.2289 Transcript_679/m.2289 type:complete len:280 (+) Transcript_679:311-1150(+)
MMGMLPSLKARRVQSRSCWLLSPWMAEAPHSRPRERESWSHMRLVEQKIIIFEPRSKDRRISAKRCILSCPCTMATCCVMDLLATRLSVSPMKIDTGWLVTNCAAMDLTSRGHVAEKKSVCRLGGICRTIFWIWGSNPISSMRSASSITRYDTWRRLIWPPSRKSLRRPGVAMTIWQPLRMSRSCIPLGAPPYTQVLRMFEARPNLSASSLIWHASSRVGASTSTVGPIRGSLRVALMCMIPGIRKAAVLPEPVLAIATTSRFCMHTGQAWDWIGVGVV